MNRNTESHFANVPRVGISRSKFDRSHDWKGTWNNGSLIPIYVDTTIMPGDTVSMDTSEVIRMMTPIAPVMDDMYADIYFFFVPYRLIWSHFKRMMGENDTAPWAQTTEYNIPQVASYLNYTNNNFKAKSLADYMGYPLGNLKYEASVLPFRAYCAIFNSWFRDENLQNPLLVNESQDSTQSTVAYDSQNYDEVNHMCRGGGKPIKVCRSHDYFSSCLPQPQKGQPVYVPLGSSAPVVFGTSNIPETAWDSQLNFTSIESLNGKKVSVGSRSLDNYDRTNVWGYDTSDEHPTMLEQPLNDNGFGYAGLYTDLSNAIGATVNQLRQAFAVQKFLERQSYGGTRYIEMIKAHFNVTNPDYRMQRPEYLGGKRIPINMNQVIQSTPTDGTSTPLGTTGAYSVTADADHMFTHSFTEHGILMGLICTRVTHSYQQGLNAQYSKKKLYDFYFPEFANLGNMPVYNKEIYLQGTSDDEEAFGYQEAWATERYFPNIVTSEMRSDYSASLDIWHYADKYDELPKLGDKWIRESESNVARTLAVQSQDQMFGDIYFKATYTRPMPLYSIPGLIDHH